MEGTNHLKLVSNTTGTGMARRSLLIYGTAFAVSVLILVVCYLPFYWLFVQIQTWRFDHPNPFTSGAAVDAIPCSFVAALIAFWFTASSVAQPIRFKFDLRKLVFGRAQVYTRS
jgi:hypothetical protein